MTLKLILILIFGIVSIVYLVTLAFKPGMFQFILKGSLMPLLLAIYIAAADSILLPIVLALIFAWIGDVLLVRITNILWFRLGLASFLIGHICYIIAMLGFAQPFNIPALIISFAAAAGFAVIAYKVVKPSNQMKIPVIAYEAIILTMAVFALQAFLAQGSQNLLFGILIFAGSLCFVVSDTMLALKTFRRAKIYFAVMITYIAAQFLIAYGFTMTGG